MLGMLGDFRDPALAKAALAVVGSNEFDPREAMSIVWTQAGDRDTRTLAWDYVRAHFDELTKKLSAEMMAYTPEVAVGFCDEPHERQMADFFKDRSPKLPGGPRILAQAEEAIALCRAYVAAQRPSVAEFIKKY
jgi:hypothetical protein